MIHSSQDFAVFKTVADSSPDSEVSSLYGLYELLSVRAVILQNLSCNRQLAHGMSPLHCFYCMLFYRNGELLAHQMSLTEADQVPTAQ